MTIKKTIILSSLVASSLLAESHMPQIGDVLKQVQPPKIEREKKEIPNIKAPELNVPKEFTDGKKVRIERFSISGAEHISNDDLKAIVAPYESKELSFKEIQDITSLITKKYREKGYFVARAYIPAQNIMTQDNRLKINVIEGNYGVFTLENSSLVKDSILQANLDDIKDENIISSHTLERAMLIIKDTPGAEVNKAEVRPGAEVGTSDFIIGTSPTSRFNGYLIGDNYGTDYTGKHRVMAGLDINSPFGIGDKLTLFGFTSEEIGLLSGKIAYDFPLHPNGTRATLSYSKTQYELGSTLKQYDAVGSSDGITARVSYPIMRTRLENLNTYTELSYNNLQDKIQNTTIKKDIYTLVSGLEYTKDTLLFNKNSQTRAGISLTLGRLDFKNEVDKVNDKDGADTQGTFSKLNLELGKDIELLDILKWKNTLQFQYAFSHKNLDGSQDLSIGGINGVKFYQDNEESAENGYIYNTEMLYTLPQLFQINSIASVFYDIGRVYTNRNFTGESARTFQDIGLGYKGSYESFFINSYLAYNIGNKVTAQKDYSSRFMLQAGYVF